MKHTKMLAHKIIFFAMYSGLIVTKYLPLPYIILILKYTSLKQNYAVRRQIQKVYGFALTTQNDGIDMARRKIPKPPLPGL